MYGSLLEDVMRRLKSRSYFKTLIIAIISNLPTVNKLKKVVGNVVGM